MRFEHTTEIMGATRPAARSDWLASFFDRTDRSWFSDCAPHPTRPALSIGTPLCCLDLAELRPQLALDRNIHMISRHNRGGKRLLRQGTADVIDRPLLRIS